MNERILVPLDGSKTGEAALPVIQKLLTKLGPRVKSGSGRAQAGAVKGMAHITGGGFIDNIPRVLPRHCDALIHKGSWDISPVFELLQRAGDVPEAEMYQVFNMGVGMVLIVDGEKAAALLKTAKTAGHKAWIIGEVVKGRGVTRLE